MNKFISVFTVTNLALSCVGYASNYEMKIKKDDLINISKIKEFKIDKINKTNKMKKNKIINMIKIPLKDLINLEKDYEVKTPGTPTLLTFGFSAQDIIYFNPKGNETPSLVGKVFHSTSAFKFEATGFEKVASYIETLTKLRETYNMKDPIPLLVEYKGGAEVINSDGKNSGIVLLKKAKGEPLHEIYQTLETMEIEKIGDIFRTIGEQMGSLDRLCCKIEMKNETYQRLQHNDSHSGNFFYDAEGKQFYWIDTADVSFVPIDKEYPFSDPENGENSGYRFIFEDLVDTLLYETIYDNNFFGKGIGALTEFFQGYLEKMDDKKDLLICEIRKGVMREYHGILAKLKEGIKVAIESQTKEDYDVSDLEELIEMVNFYGEKGLSVD